VLLAGVIRRHTFGQFFSPKYRPLSCVTGLCCSACVALTDLPTRAEDFFFFLPRSVACLKVSEGC